jgi:hypothetical protein
MSDLEIQQVVWALPQASILANKPLLRELAPYGYYKCVNTPGLWNHETAQGPLTKQLNSTIRRGRGAAISNWKKVSVERV